MLAYVCFIHFITFANMKLANIAKLATAGVGLSTLAFGNSVFAAFGAAGSGTANFGVASTDLAGTTDNLNSSIGNLFNNLALFVGLIAVAYGVYGGYLYLTASGEEEQTKKAKTIFKQVAIGILIIFLAYSIVTTLMSTLLGQTGGNANAQLLKG